MKNFYLFIILLQLSTCAFAQIEDIVTNIYNGNRLFLYGSDLYFSTGEGIFVVDLFDENNPVVSTVQQGFNSPTGMTIYNDEFYVGEFGQSRVMKFDINSSNPNVVEVTTSGQSPNVLVSYNDYLYYTDTNGGAVYKYDLNGNSNDAEILASGYIGAIGLDVKDDFLYFATPHGDHGIYKIDLTNPNSEPIELVTDLDHPLGIKVYENRLYVADQNLDIIYSYNIDEEPFQTIEVYFALLGNIDTPNDIAIYGSYFYVLEDDSLLRIPLSDLNINLGVDEFEIQRSITIYPNPTADFIQLSNIETEVEYFLYDSNGREILNGLYQPNNQINVSNLENGFYYLKLKDNSNVLRFVKS
jgi:hypothetical protein